MKALYLGPDSGTSGHRFEAFRRLGHEVRLLDPRRSLPESAMVDLIEWKVHPRLLTPWVQRGVIRQLAGERFDLAFVDGGSLVGPGLVRALKLNCRRVVSFNHDDPFGVRDGMRFAAYRAAAAEYDLVVVVRRENVDEARRAGARRVLLTYRVADEVAHAPRVLDEATRNKWRSEVAFVGTWMPERGPFLARLVELGVPLSIFGPAWERAPEWPSLRAARRSGDLPLEEYCFAVQCAQVCIGLLSVGNRDLHTTRSIEIPALGALLCAKRTPEHEALYIDGREAAFWSDTEECARVCLDLLGDAERRQRMARAGHERCLANGHFSERLLARVIDESFA